MRVHFVIALLSGATTLVAAQHPLQADDIPQAAAPLTWRQAADRIDALFVATWQREGIIPADPATDEEFIRRIYLDLAGRIPAVSETRSFLEDETADRRSRIVDELLQDPAYVRHMTIVWRNALIPQAMTQQEFRSLVPGFDAWLWERLATNMPYDQLVREIVAARLLSAQPNTPVVSNATGPDAFFAVRREMPESLAAGTSRAFLGIRLDCAQCHDHPFNDWKQHQFWNLAAFYSGFVRDDETPEMMQVTEQRDRRSIRIPGTDEVVHAVFLDDDAPPPSDRPAREQLADWLVSKQNPWFARMAVNRLWAQLFGQGIVNPVDDFSEENPPAHPEVLQLLSEQLKAHDFDLTFVIRSIVASNVYQRSSVQTNIGQQDSSMFAAAAVRGLTPEQFFDSLAEAVGFYQPYRSDNPFVINSNSPRARFIELFRSDAESALEQRTSILQALAMMNGDFVGEATDLTESRTLRAVTEFPLMSTEERVNTLFLAALSRNPNVNEQKVFLTHLQDNATNQSAALADILWVLLNSSEFLLNH